MYDNNEGLLSNDTSVSLPGDSSGSDLESTVADQETVVSEDPVSDLETTTSEVPVSQETIETLPASETGGSVSQGDAQNVMYLQMVPETDTPDYTEALAHIDVLLSVIVFVMIFDWCCRHIHNIVRMFTGRNLK